MFAIYEILQNIPTKNSTSPDGVPYILLNKCSEVIAPILTEIFRLVLDSGQIPAIWTKSHIIPIHKKNEKSNPNNYRPISLTCTICRIFERVLAKNITDFLHKNNFFTSEQFGFLQKRSTTTQLLATLEDFYTGIQEKNDIDVIYIDFKKAFDSVPIEILLRKVQKAGISGKILKFLRTSSQIGLSE